MALKQAVPGGDDDGSLSADRRQHLDYLQSAIARMAGASASAKTWLLPVVTAAYGYGLVSRSAGVTLLGAGAVALFAYLDARYLREERAFRALFRRATHDKGRPYDMNSSVYYGRKNGGPNDRRVENCEWRNVFWSWSIAGFYAPIAGVGLAIVAFVLISTASHGGVHP